MNKLFLIFIIFSAFQSCKKEENKYVPGEILVGIKSTITIEQLFENTNPFNLNIDQISGYFYTTTIKSDSLNIIKDLLNTKNYINTRNFSASVWLHFETNIINNTTFLFDMNISNQLDYISTLQLLRMKDNLSTTKNMLLKVPIGKEIYWRNKFRDEDWVTWSDLNYYSSVVR